MKELWFDDVEVGMKFDSVARTLTEADVVNFCGVSGDFHALHTDAETAKESRFGERIVHGALVLSVVTGLRSRLEIFTDALVAFAEIRSWRFLRPVLIGDTIRTTNTVVEATQTSKPGLGIVVQRVAVLNQREEVVQEGEMVSLVRRKNDYVRTEDT